MQYRLEKSVFIPDSAVEIETDDRGRCKPGVTKTIFSLREVAEQVPRLLASSYFGFKS
jgi:hypothetical protein